MDTHEVPDFHPLQENTEADVCIVGAGITGLTTAYLLSKKGVKVIVLDDGPILSGETERTTAHLSNAIDDRYFEIERVHGLECSKIAAESHSAAIDFIEHFVQTEHVDCDFLRLDGYLFLGPDQSADLLDKELEAARRAGLSGVERLTRVPLPNIEMGPCLRFPQQGQMHPTKYLSALAVKAVELGAQIFTHTHASDINEEQKPVIVHTGNGHAVRSQHVVVATNAPINDNVAIYSKQAPYRSYVIGVQIKKDAVPAALYWDTLDPYHYVRLQPFNETHDILIVGGEDHKTGHEDAMEKHLHALEQWTRVYFPAAEEILYRWSGQVFETLDGLAMIGKKPGGNEWSFIATGDSGMGMTHGTIAGMILSDLAVGSTHAWADAYDPGRFHMKSTTEFLKENADVGVTLVKDWVKPGEVDDPKKIKPGSGAVIRKGVSKIALYRDTDGKFHACSAVCPHKGCIVQWNDGEKSWDCPCHGSRYDAFGKVLTGPTIKDLEPTSF